MADYVPMKLNAVNMLPLDFIGTLLPLDFKL